MAGIIDIAVEGARLVRELTEEATGCGTNFRYEYSPESFSGTEMDNAVEICARVMETLGSTPQNPVILNLPNTVEMCTPNTYADQIEYFISHLPNKESAIISVHPHNDRGTGVACAELSMLAGRAACGRYAVRQRRTRRQPGYYYHRAQYVYAGC